MQKGWLRDSGPKPKPLAINHSQASWDFSRITSRASYTFTRYPSGRPDSISIVSRLIFNPGPWIASETSAKGISSPTQSSRIQSGGNPSGVEWNFIFFIAITSLYLRFMAKVVSIIIIIIIIALSNQLLKIIKFVYKKLAFHMKIYRILPLLLNDMGDLWIYPSRQIKNKCINQSKNGWRKRLY